MTIASLIVVVGANTVKLQKDVEQVHTSLDKISRTAATMGKALAASFVVTAVIQAGKEVLDYAGRVSDLSARLKMSTSDVQRFEAAFGPAGISIDKVAKASTELTARLVGGDKSAVAALGKMGLSVDELRKMRPEDRFIAVADAVGNLQDAGEQIYASKTLFGKAGPELLAGLDGHLGETIDKIDAMGIILDEQTIAAADNFGDQLGVLAKQGLALIATFIAPFLPLLSELANLLMALGRVAMAVVKPALDFIMKAFYAGQAAVHDFLASVIEAATRVPILGKYLGDLGGAAEWLRGSADRARKHMADLSGAVETGGTQAAVATPKLIGLGGATDKVERAARTARPEVDHFADSVDRATVKAGLSIFNLHRWGTSTLPTATSAIGANRQALLTWQPVLESVALGVGRVNAQFAEMPQRTQTAAEAYRASLGSMDGETQSSGGRMRDAMSSVVADINTIFIAAFTGGGGAAGAFRSLATTGMSALLGMIPGIGPFLAQFSGAIVAGLEALGKKFKGFFRNLFGGPSADELAGRDLVAAYEDNLSQMLTESQRMEAGNEGWKMTVIALRDKYLALGLTEADALADAERLWAASRDGAEAAKRVIEEIQRRFAGGITVPITVPVTGPGAPPVVPMAHGGQGRVSRPTLFLAGERGAEDYAFSGGGRRFSGGGGDVYVEVVNVVDGAVVNRSVSRQQSRDLRQRRKLAAA